MAEDDAGKVRSLVYNNLRKENLRDEALIETILHLLTLRDKGRGMDERMKGVADAIRVILAMGHEWPDSIGQPSSVADNYGRQFVRRILERHPDADQFVPLGSRKPADVPAESTADWTRTCGPGGLL